MVNITPEQMIKEYPRLEKWKNNPRILERLYGGLNPVTSLTGIAEKEYVNNVELLVAAVWSASTMVCCPDCGGKLEGDEGVEVTCKSRNCLRADPSGRRVVAERRSIQKLVAGDVEGTMSVLVFWPSTYEISDATAKNMLGKVVKVTGKISRIQEMKDGTKMPNISVSKLDVVEDTTVTTPSLTQFDGAPTITPKLEVPLAKAIPSEKLTRVRGYMFAMNNNVSEADLKTFVQNNVGVTWTEAEPLFVKNETTGFYSLKDESLDKLKESVKGSTKA